jgi:vacuolar-type H+-ATPase subunit E/Vma4
MASIKVTETYSALWERRKIAMNNIDIVIDYIKKKSLKEREDIFAKNIVECDNIRIQYEKEEKDEYWKYLGKSTKEVEQRHIKLVELAEAEAKKQLASTRWEMTNIAFDLAVQKLAKLPENEFKLLLKSLNLKPDFTPESLVARYKDTLQPKVESILFD